MAQIDQQLTTSPETSTSGSRSYRWIPLVIALAVLALDYLSKEIVRNNLPLYTYWAPIPAVQEFFRFTHTTNTGVAFGLFQNGNLIFTVFAILISAGIIVFNLKLEPGHLLLRIALGLQLGGAIGNLLDRLTHGAVTDFLDFGPWPVFNVADTAVVAGVILMGFVLLQEERQERSDQNNAAPEIDDTAAKPLQQDEGPAH